MRPLKDLTLLKGIQLPQRTKLYYLCLHLNFPVSLSSFTIQNLVLDVELTTRDKGKVSIYACGPTPYDHPHLGHGRTAFTYDMIRRFLRYVGYEINSVRNITDIEDKIINRASRRHKRKKK